jgi:hypothetical protein
MRSAARRSLTLLLAASLACLACRAEEGGAGGGAQAEREAALKEASEALRTLVQAQSAEITRMETVLQAPPPDFKAGQDYHIRKLREEAAKPGTSEARRREILEVEIPAEKKETKANEESLKKLEEERERAVAARKATREKMTELETQLKELTPPERKGPAEGGKKDETKAAP